MSTMTEINDYEGCTLRITIKGYFGRSYYIIASLSQKQFREIFPTTKHLVEKINYIQKHGIEIDQLNLYGVYKDNINGCSQLDAISITLHWYKDLKCVADATMILPMPVRMFTDIISNLDLNLIFERCAKVGFLEITNQGMIEQMKRIMNP